MTEEYATPCPSVALITVVDNSGVTRVKTVPVHRLPRVAETGVGLSDVSAVMAVDDGITASPGYDTPSGDMRLIPDLDAAVDLHASRLRWAPATMVDQELVPMPNCGRSILQRAVEATAKAGMTAQFAFESEFTVSDLETGELIHRGPGYSPIALFAAEEFSVDLVEAFEAQGMDVEQFHPEYADGQFEVSIRHRDPVAAADTVVLLRLTVHRMARRHGLRVSFSPRPHPEIVVGNGCHLHFSLWRDDTNLFGSETDGLGSSGGAAVAGILDHLRGIQAVLTPSVPSFERITPQHWAGAYTCWGIENREAAVRVIRGTVTGRPGTANVEIKTIDAAANPYLTVAVILHAALDGISRGLTPPEPISVDPHSLSEDDRTTRGIARLPTDLGAAIEAMNADGLVRKVFGEQQYGAYRAVRQYELETFGPMPREDQIQAHRWRY